MKIYSYTAEIECKKFCIFKTLYGIKYKKLKNLCIIAGLNPASYILLLKTKIIHIIGLCFKNDLVGKRLKSFIFDRLQLLWKIKVYRGIRNKLKYPARGQRTHTNAKTKKKFTQI